MLRCHTPLITICDTTSQIKLDLDSLTPCGVVPSALLLRKSGCPEYERVCVAKPVLPCCSPTSPTFITCSSVELPKPSLVYPLHEVDPEGFCVFVLDDKLKELGYGRYQAVVLVADEAKLPANRPAVEIDYKTTNIIFDVEYIEGRLGLNSIVLNSFKPEPGAC